MWLRTSLSKQISVRSHQMTTYFKKTMSAGSWTQYNEHCEIVNEKKGDWMRCRPFWQYLLKKSIIYKKKISSMRAKNLNLLFVHFTPGKSCHEGAENFCWGPSVTQLFHERRSAHHTLQGELASQFEFKNYFKLNINCNRC